MRYNDLLTADDIPFESETTYYWFDRMYKRIESANWMDRQVRRLPQIVYVQGSQIPIKWLRLNKNDAITDGQEIYMAEIDSLQNDIEELEKLKTISKEDIFIGSTSGQWVG